MNKVWNFIEERLEQAGESVIGDGERLITYAELKQCIKKHGDKLKARMPAKAKCGVLCKKSMNTTIALLACWYADLVPVIMSLNYGERHCKSILKLTDPDLIVTDDPEIDLIKEEGGFLYSVEKEAFIGADKEIDTEVVLKDVAIIMCTSGTTGMPKGAMITESGIIENVKAISDYFNITRQDRILIARPIYHGAVLSGELLIGIDKGCSIYFYDGEYNPFMVLQCMHKFSITTLGGTPSLFSQMSAIAGRRKMKVSIQNIVISGECNTSEIAKKIRSWLPDADIYNVYGLTESSPRVSYLKPALFDEYPESVGEPIKGVQVKIVNNDWEEVPRNQDGLLIVNGPSVMKGYYRKAEQDKLKDGWLITGDIASVNENGLIFIKSRMDNMIIKGGMNIYPKEIENVLEEEAFEEVLAYGVDSSLGKQIAVKVVLKKENTGMTEEEIMKKCQELLPPYQVPNVVYVMDEIEKSASGKKIRKN